MTNAPPHPPRQAKAPERQKPAPHKKPHHDVKKGAPVPHTHVARHGLKGE